MKTKGVTGSCLCGDVAFEIDFPTNWSAHCYCSLCRRAHGAGVVTWVGVARERFRLVHGKELLKWYRSTIPARRGFCSECGSTLLFESTRWPGEIHVAVANLDGELDRRPEGHAYYTDHVDWLGVVGPGQD